jgi:GTP cyclohydrolase I
MPAEKECTKIIPNIYKRNYENLLLFSWVNAQKQIVPTITIEQAIWQYLKFYGIDWDMESAMATYSRLQKEYYETTKKNSNPS